MSENALKAKLAYLVKDGMPLALSGDTSTCLRMLHEAQHDQKSLVIHVQENTQLMDVYTQILKMAHIKYPANAVWDMQDMVTDLGSAGYDSIVIADFHKLPNEAQRDFAFDLKVAFETSRIQFIIVGDFPVGNPLLLYNGDLCGRMDILDIPPEPKPVRGVRHG